MVADDEVEVRTLMVRALKRAGFEVLVAEDGQRAVDLFRANKSGIAAVVLDLTMPRKGGTQAFQEITQARPGVPVLLTSGYAEEDVKGRFGTDAPASFLEKPFSATALIELVRSLVPE